MNKAFFQLQFLYEIALSSEMSYRTCFGIPNKKQGDPEINSG
jgi:hypothetical protein